jgi:hypothetical protein
VGVTEPFSVIAWLRLKKNGQIIGEETEEPPQNKLRNKGWKTKEKDRRPPPKKVYTMVGLNLQPPTRQGCSAALRPSAHALRARHPLPGPLAKIFRRKSKKKKAARGNRNKKLKASKKIAIFSNLQRKQRKCF